jgi:RimJ/RimL family protein N-acetyltransferase
MNEVALREVLPDDLAVFYRQQLDDEANRMAASAPRAEDEFATHWRGILADRSVVKRTILLQDRVAGYIVSFERFGRREVGYWIGSEYWGRGTASAALREFLAEDSRRPLFAYAAVHNKASTRVLEKCGFVVVGRALKPEGLRGARVEELNLRLDGAART